MGNVLIPKPLWEPIRRGDVTVAFRRWKRLLVKPGGVYRTGAGRLRVISVSQISIPEITDGDALRAGDVDATDSISKLRGEQHDPIYRIVFEVMAGPDPRETLANTSDLSASDVAEISRRLDRLDRSSRFGPWTRTTLELVSAHPARRAPDLAEMAGRETQPFKLDVRKLKNLGLTKSLRVGYRLSPRGEAYLEELRSPRQGD